MESASLKRAPSLPMAIQFGLIGALLTLAALAWALTDERMGGMDLGPGTDPGDLGFYVTVWVVMMAAMMFPSIAPMVVMHARIQEGRRDQGRDVPTGVTPLFVAGYLVTWTLTGLAFYALLEAGRSLSIDALSWDRAGPYVAGGVIVAAAVYQLTPLKDACLRRCRSPLMFLLNAWRPGRAGAFRMGIEHGGWCVGCCWALMAALFALGVMSIGWMVFIVALIATEKLLPWKAVANRGLALLLVVLGLAVAFAPEDVPGLTLPGSPEAMRAMEAMGMEGGGGESMGGESMGGESKGSSSMGGESMGGGSGTGDSMGSGSMQGDDAGMKP
jgi:predicted metal-binding membrane protein